MNNIIAYYEITITALNLKVPMTMTFNITTNPYYLIPCYSMTFDNTSSTYLKISDF